MFVIFVAIIVIATLFFGGAIHPKKADVSSEIVGNVDTASTTEKNIGGVTYTGNGDLKIEQVPISSNVKVPNLDREVVFPSNFNMDARTIMATKIAEVITQLKSNSSNFDGWMTLGIYRKQINDYEGAIEAWNYAGVLAPKSPLPFIDLADIYGYYIKNIALAEINYLKTISNDPTEPNWYVRASNFYREVENDLPKAKAILEKGLVAIPNNANLEQALTSIK